MAVDNISASGSSPPDEPFAEAVVEEIDEVRGNLTEGQFAIPEDAAFFRELEGVEEAVIDGDIEGAQAAVDRLTGDLGASRGNSSGGAGVTPRFDVAEAFERLVESDRLSPEEARILRARGDFIDSLNDEADFQIGQITPVFTNEDRDTFTFGLAGLGLTLEDRILEEAESLDEASADREGFAEPERALYDDVRVLTDGYGGSRFSLPGAFAGAGLIESGRVEPAAEDPALIELGRDVVAALQESGELSERRAETIGGNDAFLQKVGTFLEERQRVLDGGAEGDGGNRRAIDVLIGDVGSSAGPADRYLSRLFVRDSIDEDQFRELANDIDYLRTIIEFFPDRDEPVPISADADEVTRGRLGEGVGEA